ncbi:sigma-54 interaction domain-containing protein [Maledivibacter halophilus]|uniref:Transcriptional regulator containing PAS, AAA-type ATPase, and DNA-binding Fis domains n=1 Tax=Maledivibacter halophilus TaxID=36842 RepID=A0A1T5L3G7_9FIRM|nr:sigma 54-interacting transcriptional regulator [Maledivibacter halophilus]SKC70557.1 Transcriptional regulator containing PAS, AAA-type ATPase, and DNA-binding Fis domains [Maledivibacter halophilus]
MIKEIEENKYLCNDLDSSNLNKIMIPVLGCMKNGVIIADKDGWVVYVNPVYQKVTGLKMTERMGKNILKIAPDCPLSRSLKTGKSIPNENFKLFDIDNELVANTNPITIKDKIVGVISVFQNASKVRTILKELEGSKKTIKTLSNKFAHVAKAKYGFGDIVGSSPKFMKCIQMANQIAKTESTVLILGESGTGKELFAHAIHQAGYRNDKPFVRVNCAAIPSNLLESEFFGYEKGAFTGANQQKMGMFELANEGTIFLDEIGDMSFNLQAKLLRILEEGEMYRVGGINPINVDVRVIAATNRNLFKLVKQGKFREDLYYRISVLNIEIPSLKERKDDILLLAEVFLKKANRKLGKKVSGFSKDAKEILEFYHWPGNIRELRNAIERSVAMADDDILTAQDLYFIRAESKKEIDFKNLVPLKVAEREMIKCALDKFGVSVEGKKKAADALGISLRSLYNKIR